MSYELIIKMSEYSDLLRPIENAKADILFNS